MNEQEKNQTEIFFLLTQLLFFFVFLFIVSFLIYIDLIHISFSTVRKSLIFVTYLSFFFIVLIGFLFFIFLKKNNNNFNFLYSSINFTQNEKKQDYESKRFFKEKKFYSKEDLYNYYKTIGSEDFYKKNKQNNYNREKKENVNKDFEFALKIFNLTHEEFKKISFEELKALYKSLIKKYHPDKIISENKYEKKLFEEKSKNINTSFNILKTIKKQMI